MSVSRQGKVQWQGLSHNRRCPGHQVAEGDPLGYKEGYLLLQNLKNKGHRKKRTGSVLTQSKGRHSFSWAQVQTIQDYHPSDDGVAQAEEHCGPESGWHGPEKMGAFGLWGICEKVSQLTPLQPS